MPIVCMILKKRLPKSTEIKFRINSIKRKEHFITDFIVEAD